MSQDDKMQECVRPCWDSVWMRFAKIISERSIDPRTKVGVVIVSGDNTRVLAVGYNGLERGGDNTVESLEPGMSGCLHGEDNAIIKLDYSFCGKKILYTTVSCCDMCSKRIINAGIDEVVYLDEYRDMSGIERLRRAGVKVRRYVV
jgi:dCMP deaminase